MGCGSRFGSAQLVFNHPVVFFPVVGIPGEHSDPRIQSCSLFQKTNLAWKRTICDRIPGTELLSLPEDLAKACLGRVIRIAVPGVQGQVFSKENVQDLACHEYFLGSFPLQMGCFVTWIKAIATWMYCWRKSMMIALAVFSFMAAWIAFPQPVPGLWPPKTPDELNVVWAIIEGNHTLLTFPDTRRGLFQEWHFGVKSWYLDHDFGWGARLLSFLIPAKGVIRIGAFSIPFALRYAVPLENMFRYHLSSEGRARMEKYLHSQCLSQTVQRRAPRGKPGRDDYLFFDSTRSWHPLNNCNGFIGGALRAAGLPVSESFCIEEHTTAWQLARASQFERAWFDSCKNGAPN